MRQLKYKQYLLRYHYEENNDCWEGAIYYPKIDEYVWEGSEPTETMIIQKMKKIINEHEKKKQKTKRFLK